MITLSFYEDTNKMLYQSEKGRLRTIGYNLDVRDIYAENWSGSSLRAYFGNKPIIDWFNPERLDVIYQNEDLSRLSAQKALLMMVIDPSFIKTPLLRIRNECFSGIDDFTIAHLESILIKITNENNIFQYV